MFSDILQGEALEYEDVMLIPQIGNNLNSRSEVKLVKKFNFRNKEKREGLPVFNAPMQVTGTFEVAEALLKAKMFACIHKFYKVEEILRFIYDIDEGNADISDNLFITIGIKDIEKELNKLHEIYDNIKDLKQNICIDAPNFYIPKAFEALKKVRENFKEAVIMCGNVGCSDMVYKLSEYADIIKIGISGGSVCKTRLKTGVGTPMVSTIKECKESIYLEDIYICADGGITCSGDICKSLCVGSDFVMCGGIFAGTKESDGEIIEKTFLTNNMNNNIYSDSCISIPQNEENCYFVLNTEKKLYKRYYGMASIYANEKFSDGMKEYKTSEGDDILIPYIGSIDKIIKDIKGGISSCCTYIGAEDIDSMPDMATFIRVKRQLNQVFRNN